MVRFPSSSRGFALFLAALYFTTHVALAHAVETNIWQERKKNTDAAPTVARFNSSTQLAALGHVAPPTNPSLLWTSLPKLNQPLRPPLTLERQWKNISSSALWNALKNIPVSHGIVQDVYAGRGDLNITPLVLLQDVHSNSEAQSNLAFLLERLIANSDGAVIGVEGAFDSLDFSAFKNIDDQKTVELVASSFLNNKKLAAPSFVGMTTAAKNAQFKGVDDLRHYRLNVQAFLNTRQLKTVNQGKFNRLMAELSVLKESMLSEQLLRLDNLKMAYRSGQVGLGEYSRNLLALKDQSLASLPQGQESSAVPWMLARFLSAYELERRLDFKQVSYERKAVLERLSLRLSVAEMSELIGLSQAYKMGRVGFGDYYGHLKQLCEQKGLSLKSSPSFDDYIRYVMLSDGINVNDLLAEIETTEKLLQAQGAPNQKQKTLLELTDWISLCQKLMDFSLTPNEWKRYQDSVITKLLSTTRWPQTFEMPAPIQSLLSDLKRISLKPFELFYVEADVRSEKMLENLLRPERTRNSKSNIRINDELGLKPSILEVAKPTVLVVGGFHTPYITTLLKKKELPYIVVSPKVTKVDSGEGRGYLSLFEREKTPLDLLFSGDRLFVAPLELNTSYGPTHVQVRASIWSRLGSLKNQTVAAVKFIHKKVLIDMVVRKADDPANDTYHLKNELWIVAKEYLYQAPLVATVLLGEVWFSSPVLLGLAVMVNAGASVLFGLDHLGHSRSQKTWLALMGFLFGSPLLFSNVTEMLGWGVIALPAVLHLIYNHGVWIVKKIGWFNFLSPKLFNWLPFATIKHSDTKNDSFEKLSAQEQEVKDLLELFVQPTLAIHLVAFLKPLAEKSTAQSKKIFKTSFDDFLRRALKEEVKWRSEGGYVLARLFALIELLSLAGVNLDPVSISDIRKVNAECLAFLRKTITTAPLFDLWVFAERLPRSFFRSDGALYLAEFLQGAVHEANEMENSEFKPLFEKYVERIVGYHPVVWAYSFAQSKSLLENLPLLEVLKKGASLNHLITVTIEKIGAKVQVPFDGHDVRRMVEHFAALGGDDFKNFITTLSALGIQYRGKTEDGLSGSAVNEDFFWGVLAELILLSKGSSDPNSSNGSRDSASLSWNGLAFAVASIVVVVGCLTWLLLPGSVEIYSGVSAAGMVGLFPLADTKKTRTKPARKRAKKTSTKIDIDQATNDFFKDPFNSELFKAVNKGEKTTLFRAVVSRMVSAKQKEQMNGRLTILLWVAAILNSRLKTSAIRPLDLWIIKQYQVAQLNNIRSNGFPELESFLDSNEIPAGFFNNDSTNFIFDVLDALILAEPDSIMGQGYSRLFLNVLPLVNLPKETADHLGAKILSEIPRNIGLEKDLLLMLDSVIRKGGDKTTNAVDAIRFLLNSSSEEPWVFVGDISIKVDYDSIRSLLRFFGKNARRYQFFITTLSLAWAHYNDPVEKTLFSDGVRIRQFWNLVALLIHKSQQSLSIWSVHHTPSSDPWDHVLLTSIVGMFFAAWWLLPGSVEIYSGVSAAGMVGLFPLWLEKKWFRLGSSHSRLLNLFTPKEYPKKRFSVPAGRGQGWVNELRITLKELPFFLPVYLIVTLPFPWISELNAMIVAALVHAVMSAWFARAHRLGRDGKPLSRSQKVAIGVMGYGIGALLLFPGVVGLLGVFSLIVIIASHGAFNIGLGFIKKHEKYFPKFFQRFINWVPFLTMDPLELLVRAKARALKDHLRSLEQIQNPTMEQQTQIARLRSLLGGKPDTDRSSISPEAMKRIRLAESRFLVPEVLDEIYQHVGTDGATFSDFEKLKSFVVADRYQTEPWMMGIMLMLLLSSESMQTIGLDFSTFRGVLEGKIVEGETHFYGVIQAYVSAFFDGVAPSELSQKDVDAIQGLSIELFRKAEEILSSSSALNENAITIRDLIRFYVDFSLFYMRNVNTLGQADLGAVIRQFILTAENIYGRVLETRQAREEFVQALYHMLATSAKGAAVIFKASQLKQFSSEGGVDAIRAIMNFSDYENTNPARDDNLSLFERAVDARIRRSRQTSRPLLLVTGTDDVMAVEDRLAALDQGDGRTIRVSASAFSKRKDLFGMLMPKKILSASEQDKILEQHTTEEWVGAVAAVYDVPESNYDLQSQIRLQISELMNTPLVRSSVATYFKNPDGFQDAMFWKDGFLVDIARKALAEPDHAFTIIIDNAEALPGRVRVLLNPVLWEKQADIPDRREKVQIPSNVQFIFTMDENSVVNDDSFLNRVLVQYTSSFNLSKRGFLARKTGVSNEVESTLFQLLTQLRTQTWSQAPEWSVSNLVHLGFRVAGRLKEAPGLKTNQVLAQEAKAFLSLHLIDTKDQANLDQALEKAGLSPPGKEFQLSFSLEGNIDFGGVVIPIHEDIKRLHDKHPSESVEEILHRLYGFAVSDIERRLFCQFARDWKYGTRTVEIEGTSGEGKTEISRVFSRILGLKISEITVNAATDLGDVRGRFVSSPQGGIEFEEAPYVKELEQGGVAHIFNEINTSPGSRVYYWLYPEVAGLREKTMPEFPSEEDGRAVRVVVPEKNIMRFFTVNSEGIAGREIRPRRVAALVPRYNVIPDPQTWPDLARQFFVQSNRTLETTATNFVWNAEALAPVLAAVHHAIWGAQNEKNILESGQPVTRRFMLRAIRRMNTLKRQFPQMSQEHCFSQAVTDIYGLPWKFVDDRRRAYNIIQDVLRKYGLPEGSLQLDEALNMSLLEGSPLMVFQDASGPLPAETLMDHIRAIDPTTKIIRIPLGFYHDARSWQGAWMPVSGLLSTLDRLIVRLAGLRAQKFEFQLGIIGSLILEARLSSGAVTALFENYSRLNAKTMPLLNEFLQTGELASLAGRLTQQNADSLLRVVERHLDSGAITEEHLMAGCPLAVSLEKLRKDAALRMKWARWFLSHQPANLKLVATASSQEEMMIGGPEMDRFITMNISQTQDETWVQHTVSSWLTDNNVQLDANKKRLLIETCQQGLKAYQAHLSHPDHSAPHVRFSLEDIHALLSELLLVRYAHNKDDTLFERDLKSVAYYSWAMGLHPSLQKEFGFTLPALTHPEQSIGFRKDSDKKNWIFYADGFEIETRYPSDQPVPNGFLAPTQQHVRAMASLIIAWRHHRWTVIEGFQGGGKSALVPALAKRMGVPSYDELMFDGIDLGGFLGRLSTKGNELVLSAQPDQNGRFLLNFLNAYQDGGVVNLDEGAVGGSAQKVVEFLVSLAAQMELNLSHYHPGCNITIKRHADFRLFVTQNPAGITLDRLGVPYEADARAHKIWADNVLNADDALLIVNHHLGEAYTGSAETPDLRTVKEELVSIHLGFLAKHPTKEELSPRQLILMALSLKEALGRGAKSLVDLRRAVFRGAMVAYFERLPGEERPELGRVLGPLALQFSQEWQAPVDRSRGQFGGVAIAESSTASNISESMIRFPEDIPSQNGALRSLAYGLSLGMPVALLEAVGADALDLVQKFAHKTGRQVDVLWSHSDMTRSHLVDALVPVFEEEFNEQGVRDQQATREFRQALGFLTRHMLTRKDYEREAKKSQHPQRILFFHMMDAIPERQRVVLNHFLSRMGEHRALVVNDAEGRPTEYILPSWVGLVVSAPVNHRFSSPFMNRFLPIRVEPFSFDETRDVVQQRFPYVDDREFHWLWTIVEQAVKRDRENGFDVSYGFSPEDIFKLASAIQELKKRSWRPLKQDPLYYVVRAVQLVVLGALKESDLNTFEDQVMLPLVKTIFRKPLLDKKITEEKLATYYRLLKRDMFEELSHAETRPVQKSVRLSDLSDERDFVLPNGFRFRYASRSEGKLTLITPARTYPLTLNSIKNGLTLTPEMRVSLSSDGKSLVLDYQVLKSVGRFNLPQDNFNIDRAIPIHEVPTQAFMEMTPEHVIFLSGIVNAWQSRADKLSVAGQARLPRVVMINGDTGVAKTSGMVNAALVTGLPLYVMNSYEDMRVSDVTMSLSVDQGKIQLNAKELLSRIGKIRRKGTSGPWQKLKVAGKTTASRSLIVWDEANVATALAHPLAPLFRGETQFDFEYLGETWEVQIEDEVFLALNFNPAETYVDRGQFAPEISGLAHKFWPANPARYADDQLKTILDELTRRGVRSVHEAMERRQTPSSLPPEVEGHIQNTRVVLPSSHDDTKDLDSEAERQLLLTLKRYSDPDQNDEWLNAIEDFLERNEVGEQLLSQAPTSPDNKEPSTAEGSLDTKGPNKDQEFELTYDMTELKFHASQAATKLPSVIEFASNVLAPFLQAVSDMQFTNGSSENKELARDVFLAAKQVDVNLEPSLRHIFDMYVGGRVDEKLLDEHLMVIRRILASPQGKTYLLVQEVSGASNEAPHLFVQVQPILHHVMTWKDEYYLRLGIDKDSPLRRQPDPQVLLLGKSPVPGMLGYWEGEFAVAFQEAIRSVVQGHASVDEAVLWTVFHEMGHMIDQRRHRAEKYEIPDNVELNAMLFPLIFADNNRYFDRLYDRVSGSVDSDDVYAQAVKGILNGLWKLSVEMLNAKNLSKKDRGWMGQVFSDHDLSLIANMFSSLANPPDAGVDGAWISDQFEPHVVEFIIKALKTLSPELVQKMAAQVYQRRSVYLNTVKPGFLKTQLSSNGSGWQKQLMAGLDKGYQQKIVGRYQGKDIKVKSKSGQERPKMTQIPISRKGDGKGGGVDPATPKPKPEPKTPLHPSQTKKEGREGSSPFPSTRAANSLELPKIPPSMLTKFMALFAGAPVEIRFLSDEGEEIDLTEFASSKGMTSDFFIRVQQTRAQTRGHFAVTVDVSLSTSLSKEFTDPKTGTSFSATVNSIFVEMARQYTALFHRAAVKNQQVRTALATHGNNYNPILSPKDSHRAAKVKEALATLAAHPADEINNFQSVIQSILDKHKKRDGLPILEIVITDGLVSVDEALLWEAHQKGIDIVIVGYEMPEVLKFPKSVNLPEGTDASGLLAALLKIAELKAKRKDGKLPYSFDLSERLGLTRAEKQNDTRSPNPINIKGVTVATVVSSVLALIATWLTGEPRMIIWLVPLMFFSLAVFVWFVSLGSDTDASTGAISLWGIPAISSPKTDFIAYDNNRKEFQLNPVLYSLLGGSTWGVRVAGERFIRPVIQTLTLMMLWMFMVPLHERLHVWKFHKGGWKNEMAPYFSQALVWEMLAVMGLAVSMKLEPIAGSLMLMVFGALWVGRSVIDVRRLNFWNLVKELKERPSQYFSAQDKPQVKEALIFLTQMLAKRFHKAVVRLYELILKIPANFFDKTEKSILIPLMINLISYADTKSAPTGLAISTLKMMLERTSEDFFGPEDKRLSEALFNFPLGAAIERYEVLAIYLLHYKGVFFSTHNVDLANRALGIARDALKRSQHEDVQVVGAQLMGALVASLDPTLLQAENQQYVLQEDVNIMMNNLYSLQNQTALLAVWERFPQFLTEEKFLAVFRTVLPLDIDFIKKIAKLFKQNGATPSVQAKASVLHKALTDSSRPAQFKITENNELYIVTLSDKNIHIMLRRQLEIDPELNVLAAIWNQYGDEVEVISDQVQEQTFWNAVGLLIHDSVRRHSSTDLKPINVSNSLAAFLIASAVFLMIGASAGIFYELVPLFLISTMPLAMFGIQALVVAKWSRLFGVSHRRSGPIMLWGRPGVDGLSSDFIAYDTDRNWFRVHPRLHELISFNLYEKSTIKQVMGFGVRTFAFFVLWVMMIPIHERLHAWKFSRSNWKDEIVPFSAQGLLWFATASMFVFPPFGWDRAAITGLILGALALLAVFDARYVSIKNGDIRLKSLLAQPLDYFTDEKRDEVFELLNVLIRDLENADVKAQNNSHFMLNLFFQNFRYFFKPQDKKILINLIIGLISNQNPNRHFQNKRRSVLPELLSLIPLGSLSDEDSEFVVDLLTYLLGDKTAHERDSALKVLFSGHEKQLNQTIKKLSKPQRATFHKQLLRDFIFSTSDMIPWLSVFYQYAETDELMDHLVYLCQDPFLKVSSSPLFELIAKSPQSPLAAYSIVKMLQLPSPISVQVSNTGQNDFVDLSNTTIRDMMRTLAGKDPHSFLKTLELAWSSYSDEISSDSAELKEMTFWNMMGVLVREAESMSRRPIVANSSKQSPQKKVRRQINHLVQSADSDEVKRQYLFDLIASTPLKLELDQLVPQRRTGSLIGDASEVVADHISQSSADLKAWFSNVRFMLTSEKESSEHLAAGSFGSLTHVATGHLIVVQWLAEDNIDESLNMATQMVLRAARRKDAQETDFYFVSNNPQLKQAIEKIETVSRVRIHVVDNEVSMELSKIIQSPAQPEVWFVAPPSQQGKLRQFLNDARRSWQNSITRNNNFRIFLLATHASNPLMVEFSFDQIQNLEGLLKTIRTIQQNA